MMTKNLGGAAGRPGAQAFLRVGVAAIALLGAAGLAMQVNASEAQDGHGAPAEAGHGAAAGGHGTAEAGQGAAGSRVFGAVPAAAGADGHAPATPAANHGESVAMPAPPAQGGAHWGYSGAGGPEHWGSLNGDYALCETGRMQSPVDLTGGMKVSAEGIEFKYKVTDLVIGNNGHTVQVDYHNGSHILVDGERYDLLQFHFHTPSEHLFTGRKSPMEMHLVHKNAAGTLAVVGVMMEMGEENIALAEVWSHLPGQAGDPQRIEGIAMNARDLLPEGRQFHHYKGSLTTPPCSEGVNWFVMTEPIQVSAEQVRMFADIIGDNARPQQAAHNRLFVTSN